MVSDVGAAVFTDRNSRCALAGNRVPFLASFPSQYAETGAVIVQPISSQNIHLTLSPCCHLMRVLDTHSDPPFHNAVPTEDCVVCVDHPWVSCSIHSQSFATADWEPFPALFLPSIGVDPVPSLVLRAAQLEGLPMVPKGQVCSAALYLHPLAFLAEESVTFF